MRGPLILLTGAALAAALSGCAGADPAPSASLPAPPVTPTPTYELPPRPVRPGESPVRAAPVTDGDTRFQVIGLQKGLSGFFGSHAEWQAKGQYVIVRILVENPGRTNARFDAKRQRLVASDGVAYAIDKFAQAIKRQPDELPLGAGVRVELDLWYDIPKEAKVSAIQLFGDPPLGVTGGTDGVRVPLA
ncbi:DUF4352 domain-containing protein [Streptosporangium sp. NPDC002721]|uniref:DUF4352 domain-containing protein n=1 Tax=Streptosporangium sp. NPDC002721 TaxID=3366188 RepID=UPI0036852BCD